MTIGELHSNLVKAYSIDNLNRISLILIDLYKNQQFSILNKISEIISEWITIEIKENGKEFSKFMMLYHPDRAGYHLGRINDLFNKNNFDGLLEYSHILKLERIDEIATALDSYEDIDYSPVYEWDFDTEGFTIIEDSVKTDYAPTKVKGYTFYDAIKIREYGHTDIEYPSCYLEDIEEFELSSSEINDLDGIQFCIHAKVINLSNNLIFDLSYLDNLPQLEELNLSDNTIGYIDSLANVLKLKSVDLSNNNIDDITPLFDLEYLEYVNLSGNQVNLSQINKLIELGVTVDY